MTLQTKLLFGGRDGFVYDKLVQGCSSEVQCVEKEPFKIVKKTEHLWEEVTPSALLFPQWQ